MSPALLSKRLEGVGEGRHHGCLAEVPAASSNTGFRRPARISAIDHVARLLGPALGELNLSLKNLDPSLLMWDMRRHLNPQPLPPQRCTIQFQYPELPNARRNWWLVVESGKVDLCGFDPGYEIDLLVRGPLKVMTAIWMGIAGIRREVEAGSVELDGDPAIASAMQQWLGLSPFAMERAGWRDRL